MTATPQAWSVQLAPAAARAIDRLPHKIAAAMVEFITGALLTNPRRMSKPLRHELVGWHVARRGDYRVNIRICDDDRVLLIGRIEHRSQLYRRAAPERAFRHSDD